MRPLIGITTNYVPSNTVLRDRIHLGAKAQAFSALSEDYVRSIIYAGGTPILIPQYADNEYLENLLPYLDGILLSGGNDINPLTYKERSNGKSGTNDPIRDDVELYIAKYIIQNKKPVLGICRGFQLLNVALGGTLHEDLMEAGFMEHSLTYSERYIPVHSVFINKNTNFFNIHGVEKLMVNSLHHQGVDKLGENLISAATSEDGVCEAFELEHEDYLMAVQWHPEMMSYKFDEFYKIFERFIDICNKYKHK